jgi:hypothetical protein
MPREAALEELLAKMKQVYERAENLRRKNGRVKRERFVTSAETKP